MIGQLLDLTVETPRCEASIKPEEVGTSRIWLLAIDPGTGDVINGDGSLNIVYEATHSQN